MSQAAHPTFAYVGCFTVSPGARKTGNGKGISVYRIDRDTQAWTLVQVCATLPHPAFLALNRDKTALYSAHGDGVQISAYSIDRRTGKLTFLNHQPTRGHNGHHLTIDPANRYVLLDKGAGIAVFPINADGSLAPFCENVEPAYESPRGKVTVGCTHQVVFDPSGRFVIVPERNRDKVLVYAYNARNGTLAANDPPYMASKDWAGPRHIAFHPSWPLAYVINETDSTVTAYNWDSLSGELSPFQIIATTPADFSGENMGSEVAVAPSGKFVYASNRGHDSIAIFSVDAYGALKLEGWEASRGKTPRFFSLVCGGSVMYVANQDSDSIVAFKVDDSSGKLTPTGQLVETGTPTCIAFAYH